MTTTTGLPKCAQFFNDMERIDRELEEMKAEVARRPVQRSLVREMFPLVKKTRPLERKNARQENRMRKAMVAATQPLEPLPIILDVIDPQCNHYYLAFYPLDYSTGMKVLQSLATLGDQERTELLLAMHNPDVLACVSEKEIAMAQAIVRKHCFIHNVGRFERTFDIDDLSPFLYHQFVKLV